MLLTDERCAVRPPAPRRHSRTRSSPTPQATHPLPQLRLTAPGTEVVGLGVTCALATVPAKRGDQSCNIVRDPCGARAACGSRRFHLPRHMRCAQASVSAAPDAGFGEALGPIPAQAAHTIAGVTDYHIKFTKGHRDRVGEVRSPPSLSASGEMVWRPGPVGTARPLQDAVVSRLAVVALAEACGVSASHLLDGKLHSEGGESVDKVSEPVGCAASRPVLAASRHAGAHLLACSHLPRTREPLEALLARRTHLVEMRGGRCAGVGATAARVVLCGSFNPLHDGHKASCAAAPAREPAL